MATSDRRFDATADTTRTLETVANPRRVRVTADGSPVVASSPSSAD